MGRYVTLAIAVLLFSMGAAASPLGPDGAPGVRLPGKFVWLELATENPDSARAFYGAVFGWKIRALDGAPASYSVIENETSKVAGVFRHERPAGGTVGARWLALISVRDPREAAQLVRARGGEVLVAPKVVRGRGMHAVFRDPDGAVFGVLNAEGGDPPDTPVEEGDVFWLDLFTRDPAKAAAFYSALAGYDVNVGEVAGRQRTVLSTNGIARAGVARPVAGAGGPAWLPYILVADVRETLERVRQAKGRVVMPPRADLLDGRLAVIADREGGVIGIVELARSGRRTGSRAMKIRGAIALVLTPFILGGCATTAGGGGASVDFYGGYYYDDWWYAGGGCCVDYPGDIGPVNPRPEHPIALPPGSAPRPENPIATPPKAEPKASTSSSSRSSSMPAPRASAPMRSMGGGGRGGGRR